MDSKTISISGTDYAVLKKKYEDEPIFKKKGIDGYCDAVLKQIVYCDMSTYPGFDEMSPAYCRICERHTVRHEIIHAFLNESGLQENSNIFNDAWARNEEMVDWFAIQFHKIFAVFKELDVLE